MIPWGYPFKFIHRDWNCGKGIRYTDVYRFKSTKSNLTYFVNVELYGCNMYSVKFYQKNHKLSPRKYQILSNTFEPRTIIYTCMSIMGEILKINPYASFGFIGSNCDGESVENTKRYRFYSRIVATKIDNLRFLHIENVEKSAYLLVNRRELDRTPDLMDKIEEEFSDLYDYFE